MPRWRTTEEDKYHTIPPVALNRCTVRVELSFKIVPGVC